MVRARSTARVVTARSRSGSRIGALFCHLVAATAGISDMRSSASFMHLLDIGRRTREVLLGARAQGQSKQHAQRQSHQRKAGLGSTARAIWLRSPSGIQSQWAATNRKTKRRCRHAPASASINSCCHVRSLLACGAVGAPVWPAVCVMHRFLLQSRRWSSSTSCRSHPHGAFPFALPVDLGRGASGAQCISVDLRPARSCLPCILSWKRASASAKHARSFLVSCGCATVKRTGGVVERYHERPASRRWHPVEWRALPVPEQPVAPGISRRA